MARVQRIALFEREVRERLSPSSLELILGRLDVMSEGQRETRAGGDLYLGSTMLTLALGSLAGVLRDACDAACAQRLARQLQDDGVALTRLKAIAAKEVERLAGARPKGISAEAKVRSQGSRVFVDIDVEATF